MEAQALYIGRAFFSVELHPFFGNAALEGVTEELNTRIMRWDDGLNGLLLSYTKLQNMPAQATVRPHFPFIQLKVAADVLVFKPAVGMALSGRVNKLGADFIGYKILGSINGAVGRQNIRKDLEYCPQDGCWACKNDPRSKIGLGSDILFCVHGLQVEGDGVLTVWGSMKESWTGATPATAFTWPSAFPDQRFTQDEEAHPSTTPKPASGALPAVGISGELRPDVVLGDVQVAGISERQAPAALGAKVMQGGNKGSGAEAAGGGIDGGRGTTGGIDAVPNGGLEGKRKKKKRKKGMPSEGLDGAATPSGRADAEVGAGDAAVKRSVQAVTAGRDGPLPNGGSQHHKKKKEKKKEKGSKPPINQVVGEDVKFGLDGDRPKIRKLTKPQSAAWGEFPGETEQVDRGNTGLVKRKKQKKIGSQTG